jgi:hypothetical protein
MEYDAGSIIKVMDNPGSIHAAKNAVKKEYKKM